MCDPVTMAITYAAMTGLQIKQEQNVAKAQIESLTNQAKAANTAAMSEAKLIEANALTDKRQFAEEALKGKLAAARAVSSARVSAGEGGVEGAGVNRLVQQISQQGARNLNVTEANRLQRQMSLGLQTENVGRALTGTINQIRGQQVGIAESTTHGLGALLKIGLAGMSGASTSNDFNLDANKLTRAEKSNTSADFKAGGDITRQSAALDASAANEGLNFDLGQFDNPFTSETNSILSGFSSPGSSSVFNFSLSDGSSVPL